MDISRDKDQKEKETPSVEKTRDNDQEETVYEHQLPVQRSFFNFHF